MKPLSPLQRELLLQAINEEMRLQRETTVSRLLPDLDELRVLVLNDRLVIVDGMGGRENKLNPTQVREIRRLHEDEGLGYKRLAHQFGVHATTIRAIILGRAWTEENIAHWEATHQEGAE